MARVDKSHALVVIAHLLCQGASLSKKQIANRFGVSTRTAHRWMVDVECALPTVRDNGVIMMMSRK